MVPALNPKGDDYDQEKVEALEAMVSGFERRGKPSAAALVTAVSMLFDVDLTGKPSTSASSSAPAAVRAEKKPDAKKAVDTMKKQPPAADGMGVNKDDTRLRIADLSDEEFDKLPASTKARYRGDILAA